MAHRWTDCPVCGLPVHIEVVMTIGAREGSTVHVDVRSGRVTSVCECVDSEDD